MSKGIIVVDRIPATCCHIKGDGERGCIYGGMECKLTHKVVQEYIDERTKPDWCPIREMPEKKDYKGPDAVAGAYVSDRVDIVIHEAGKLGWNSCIDEILREAGGTDET